LFPAGAFKVRQNFIPPFKTCSQVLAPGLSFTNKPPRSEVILKELLKQIATKSEERQEKLVSLFIGAKEYEFLGEWQWELHSTAVYCSDVMLHFPPAFEGTKGILHPDDKTLVQDRISSAASTIPFLQFRIITTYGEVKLLTGKSLQFCEVASSINPAQEVQEPLKDAYELSKQAQKLQWQARATVLAEHVTASGTWYLNTVTNEMYYSDGVYHLHGLPPQSLNAHLHSFSSFIHPDDREMVRAVLAKSVQQKLPLHIEYRIQLTGGKEKKLRQTTYWEFADNGAMMLYGSMVDMSHQTALEQKAETAEHELSLKSRILQMNEQVTGTGYWYINLLTRKISFSDNVYRLHGIKPKSVPAGINIFLNYIHPDDREIVKEITKKIIRSHEPPDIDFRVLRSDGTVRYLRQRGKMIVYGEGEMVMIVSLEDITKDKVLERKSAEMNEAVLAKNFIHNQVEATAGIGSWIWDVESGAISWSDGIYNLLGYKTGATTLSYKSFLRFIHTDDRKAVVDSIEMLLHEKKELSFPFRIIRLGQERFIQASFKLVANSARELFIATLHDVTQVHRMKEQLAKQVQLAESISQNIHDAVFITDENNNILLWNKTCEEQFGVKRSEALHQNFFDVMPQLKEDVTLTQFQQALKGQPVILHRNRLAHARGYYDLMMIPLHNDEGAVNGILHLLHNVTIEYEMEQRLTERLNFIESLLEASVDRILVLDRHMNYIYCNQKAAAHFGLAKEELIGKNVLEIFPASITNPSYEYFRKALRGETIHIPAIDSLLEEHYGQVYLVPIKENTADVTAVLWIWQDLSSEIKLQRQLKKSDEILTSIDVVFIELDRDYRFLYINPTAEKFLRNPKEAVLGEVVWELFPQLVNTKGYDAILKALSEQVKVEVEYYSAMSGRWVFMSVTPSDDGVIILFYDRQDIKETQQSLQEEHRRLQDAQELGSIGSFEWNVGEGKAIWSDELYRINGMEPQSEAITAAKIDTLIHPEDLEGFQKLKEQSLVTPGFYKHIHRIINPDGTVKLVHHQFESIPNAKGEIVRVHGILQDITRQKRTDFILNTINEVCFELDNEFRITYANQQALDSWKMLCDDVIGKNMWDVFPEDRDTPIYDAVNEAHQTQKPVLTEVWCPVIDRWIYLRITPAVTGLILMHFDITERRIREEEIRKNLAILQQSEDLAQIGSWEYDIASGDFTWSDGMYDLFSLPKGKKVAPGIYKSFALEADVDIAGRMADNIEKYYKAFDEVMRIKKAGGVRTLKVKSSVLYNNVGQPVKVVGVDLDITEAVEGEKKIQEGRHLLEQTTAATPDAITIFDLEKKEPAYLNNCLASWLGYTTDELMEMGFDGRLQMIDPRGRKDLQAFNEGMLSAEDGETKTVEYRVKTKEGTYIWVRNRAKVFKRNSGGKPVQILSVLQDITKEVDLHKQLVARTQLIEALVENNVNCIASFDINLRITNWNRRYEEEVGKTKEEVMGKGLLDVFPDLANDEEIMNAFEKSKMGEKVHVPLKDTMSGKYFEFFYIPLKDEKARVYGILTIGNDITSQVLHSEELKNLNESLEQKNKELESKNEEITDFAFIASHDLKEPIRKIRTFSNWLMDKEADGLSMKGKEFVYKMDAAVKRIDALIEDITTLTKIQALKELHEEVNLNGILETVVDELDEKIKESNAVIEGPGLPVIKGNKKQLLHLFKNIISNSIKFQLPGVIPVVKIKASRVQDVEGLPLGAYLKISITDNGIGFDAQYASKIFKVFQRLHAQAQYAGTGIGLAICKKIMENHHGHITAASTQNKGAVFCCYFPL
jgi:PAS domain S-box-containing protein